MRNLVRSLLALVLLCGALLSTPVAAHASSGVWVPPSWTSTTAGDSASGRGGLSGAGSYSVSEPSSSTGVNAAFLGSGSYVRVHVTGFGGASALTVTATLAGTVGNMTWNGASYFQSECSDGYTYGAASWTGAALAANSGTFSQTWSWSQSSDRCATGGHGSTVAWRHNPYANRNIIDDPAARITVTGSGVMTTELTCRDLETGEDQTVTESAAGASPSPVCPSGTAAVRVRVIAPGGVVVQDTSVSTAWADWSQYVGDGGGYAVPGVGGVPCVIGMTCAIDPWWESPAAPPSNADCWLMVSGGAQWVLAPSDCQGAYGDGKVQPPTGTGEQANGTDLNPLMRLLEGLTSGIKSAINAVKSAINAVKSAVDGVRQAINSVVNGIAGIVQAIADAVNSIISAISNLGDRIGFMLEDALTCNTGRCSTGGMDAALSGFKDKFDVSQWQSQASSIGAFFDRSCQCVGYHIEWSWGVPGSGAAVIKGDIGNSCSGSPLQQVAAFSLVVSRVIIVVGTLAASLRLLGSAFSFAGLIGDMQQENSRMFKKEDD